MVFLGDCDVKSNWFWSYCFCRSLGIPCYCLKVIRFSERNLINLYKYFEVTCNGLFSYKTYLIFLFASLAISIGLQMVLPFPYGLAAALAIFIIFPLMLRRRYMSRLRGYGGSGTGSGGGFFGMNTGGSSVRYICLVCNNKYKGGSCPRCGSKMKRADF